MGEIDPFGRLEERVLLVDDEPSVLHVSALFLEDLGYEVLSTTSPREALEIVAREGRRLNALMTDVVMPEMSGVELAARVREQLPQLPVLFFSAHTEGVISGGLRTRFLHKPFYQAQLAEVIRELLDQAGRGPSRQVH